MISVGATVTVFACVGAIAFVGYSSVLAARCRLQLRPHAERLIVEKRWMERSSRSKREFTRRWGQELRNLYRLHVSRPKRMLLGLGGFEMALNAEFASITNQEIASWTFIDRNSSSRASFEQLVARCLEHESWRVTTLRGADRVDLHLILSDGRRRIGVYCHHGAQSPECLAVHDAAMGQLRQNCDAVCIITNARFSRPVAVFAETKDVVLLHCSQLDRIAELERSALPPAMGESEGWRMAA